MKHAALIFILVFAFASFACSGDEKQAGASRAGQEIAKDDGSTVAVTTTPEGFKSETRTFPSGDVARATRITKPDGNKRALVEFRDGRTVELKGESDVNHLMDASADSIKNAANQTWEAMKAAGEKVGGEISDKTKQAAEATKDAAADAAEAAGKAVKKAGRAVKNAGEKVKDKVTP